MSDIFISYAREDQSVAQRLAACFEQRGWSVWWDPMLRAGEHYDDVIESALDDARCVVVLWSEHSVRSRYVLAEASFALERNVLVPVALAAVEQPLLFRRLHTSDLHAWRGEADTPELAKLLDDMAATMAVAASPDAPAPTGRPTTPSSPEGVAGTSGGSPAKRIAIGVAALAVTLALVWLMSREEPDPEPHPLPPASPPSPGDAAPDSRPGGVTAEPQGEAEKPPVVAVPRGVAPVPSGFREVTITRWHYVGDDDHLGYGSYPEHPAASSGSACTSVFRVEADAGKTYHNVPTTRVVGVGTGPGQVFVASPGGDRASVRRTVAESDGRNGWYASYPAFNGDFAPAGDWLMVISYPAPQAPADTAAGDAACAQHGPATIRFNW